MRVVVFGMIVALVGVLFFSGAASASSRGGGVSLSTDGTTWNSSLPGPLFNEEVRWVPGDTRTERFYVRNDSGVDASMQIRILNARIDELIRVGDLEVATRIDGGAWQSTQQAGERVLSEDTIAAAATRTVNVRVSLPAASTNVSQVRQLDLRLKVILSADSDASLSPTGTNPLSGVLTAGMMVTVGAVLLALAARRRDAEREGSHATS